MGKIKLFYKNITDKISILEKNWRRINVESNKSKNFGYKSKLWGKYVVIGRKI